LPLSLHGAALITLIIKSRDCLEKCDVSLGSVEQYLVHTTNPHYKRDIKLRTVVNLKSVRRIFFNYRIENKLPCHLLIIQSRNSLSEIEVTG
jgi:hypothetical protein